MGTTKATPNVALTGSDVVHSLGSVSGAVAIDFSLGLAVELSLSADATLTFSNWPAGFHSTATLYITANGHTPTFPAEVTWAPSSAPSWAATGVDVIICSTLDGDPVFARTAVSAPASLPGFNEAVDDRVAALLVAGSGIGLSYNDGANTLTVSAPVAGRPFYFEVFVTDETTALTTGTAKTTFRVPFAGTFTAIRASLTTASSSGLPAINVKKAGVSIFSTTLTIDATEKTSVTAATPAVISTAAFADNDEFTIDIDTAGTGAAGLKLVFIGTLS
jgi:hypothetical protein